MGRGVSLEAEAIFQFFWSMRVTGVMREMVVSCGSCSDPAFQKARLRCDCAFARAFRDAKTIAMTCTLLFAHMALNCFPSGNTQAGAPPIPGDRVRASPPKLEKGSLSFQNR